MVKKTLAIIALVLVVSIAVLCVLIVMQPSAYSVERSTAIAAGTFLFLLPVAVFTFLLRGHLLRGVTFGAIRK